jgi:TPP-dependent pyruvate/acetoin dehydrogenase alpha subunit
MISPFADKTPLILDKDFKIHLLRSMIRIREFENAVGKLKLEGKIFGQIHSCIGQEALVVGTCLALDKSDYLISNHRSHGHLIAKGANLNSLMAEIFGKSTGTNGGRGGSMHLFDKEIGAICTTAIVGSGLPVSCGSALASKILNDNKITCVFFGDGAANEGVFSESLNIASLWKLPVLFLLENNGVAITTLLQETTKNQIISERATSYDIHSVRVDGQDVESVFTQVSKAIRFIRNGNGPIFIEGLTFRFNEHAEGLHYLKMKDVGYRNNEFISNQIIYNDPIMNYYKELSLDEILQEEEFNKIVLEEKKLIDDALIYAENSPKPAEEDVYKNIFI